MPNKSLYEVFWVAMYELVKLVLLLTLLVRVESKLRTPPFTEMLLGVESPAFHGAPSLHFIVSNDVPLNWPAKVNAQVVPAGGLARADWSQSSTPQPISNASMNPTMRITRVYGITIPHLSSLSVESRRWQVKTAQKDVEIAQLSIDRGGGLRSDRDRPGAGSQALS